MNGKLFELFYYRQVLFLVSLYRTLIFVLEVMYLQLNLHNNKMQYAPKRLTRCITAIQIIYNTVFQ